MILYLRLVNKLIIFYEKYLMTFKKQCILKKFYARRELLSLLAKRKIGNYSACEGIGGSGVAAKPPHHSPHPSAAGLPEQLQEIVAYFKR